MNESFHDLNENANSLIGRTRPSDRQFSSYFGIDRDVCEKTWQLIARQNQHRLQPNHFLWGLLLLKVYSTESVLSGISGVTEKTFRKWSWYAIDSISRLQVVS